MYFLFFLLASAGMTFIVVDGTIFNSIKLKLGDAGYKKIVDMINCPQCFGFWAGVTMGILLDPLPVFFWPFRIFAYGCASSFVAYFAAIVMSYLLMKESND